jgi:hypothetical protein
LLCFIAQANPLPNGVVDRKEGMLWFSETTEKQVRQNGSSVAISRQYAASGESLATAQVLMHNNRISAVWLSEFNDV